jgi:hypothetical protein
LRLRHIERFGAVRRLGGEELLVELQLLGKRAAQRGVVKDDKDFLAGRHARSRSWAGFPGGMTHMRPLLSLRPRRSQPI